MKTTKAVIALALAFTLIALAPIAAAGPVQSFIASAVRRLATAPSSATNGDAYYDTTLNAFKFRENGSWKSIPSGTTFPLLAPLGTAGAPSYSFSAHTNSGMYYDENSADGIIIEAGGGGLGGPMVWIGAGGADQSRLAHSTSEFVTLYTGNAQIQAANIALSGATTISGGSTGHVRCDKSDGTLGYCSTTPTNGSCTCN